MNLVQRDPNPNWRITPLCTKFAEDNLSSGSPMPWYTTRRPTQNSSRYCPQFRLLNAV
jgi:hypothetical protein